METLYIVKENTESENINEKLSRLFPKSQWHG